ncbi:NAD(P)-binding domain-containing protein [Lysobacter sp. CA196]|uniref:NAD(P)-binding domain-containing protein n=1 Tax=Lysobacter sp. CA196 TaxID=3455606 RepID=UPI003F8D51BD
MIAIIGGGPAGIALAAALDRLGLNYELFEAREIGATWRAAPSDLRVLSPWWTNVLSFGELLSGNPFRKPHAGEYLDHLLRIARRLRGRILEGAEVLAIEEDGNGNWNVRTADGISPGYSSVAMATGYFFSPSWPSPPLIEDGSVRILHAAQIGDYAQLEELRTGDLPVVVVGRRVTAGQLMLELNDRGIPCALSLRSPIEFRRHGFIAGIREAAYFFWEELQARLSPGIKRPSYPVMDGGRGRELVENGEIAVWPTLKRVENGEIVLNDDRRMSVAAVIMATGYRAVLDLLPYPVARDGFDVPLNTSFEVQGMPGVYLLGFDNLYDHRSRYLRGIRFDAARLAKILAARQAPTD